MYRKINELIEIVLLIFTLDIQDLYYLLLLVFFFSHLKPPVCAPSGLCWWVGVTAGVDVFVCVCVWYSCFTVVFVFAEEQIESLNIYTYNPSFLDFLTIQVTTEHQVESPVPHSRFSLGLSVLCRASIVYMFHSLSSNPRFLPLAVQTFVLYIFVSICALQISLSVPVLQIPRVNIFISLSDLLHFVWQQLMS